jgi:phospholipid transport system substrate-binding protein
MLKRIAFVALIGLFVTTYAFANVTGEVKKTVDEVVKILSDKEMKKSKVRRRQALRQTIGGIFDYTEISKRSLGKYWKQRTPAEQKQFVDLFAALLERTYANKIESYNNEKIIYLSEKVEGNYAEVKSKVISASHDEFTLDYKLINENGKWMVYDVVVEGISLVSNYRGQFSRIISEHGYGELLTKLQGKSEDMKVQQ